MTITENLLNWYEKNARDLPWRVKGGPHPNPYEVWISEIMLQQTLVKTVEDYFNVFLKRFPDVFTLANASEEEVLMMWQGLGYYSRARKLYECAKVLVRDYQGEIPKDKKVLLRLPGIGKYTAAAIASIAFNQHEAVIDGNVIRVLTRLKGWEAPVLSLRKQISSYAEKLVLSAPCPADYSSAIMDLGACVCKPKPLCELCPLSQDCLALKNKTIENIPHSVSKKKKNKAGYVFWIENDKKEILVRKRTEKGLLSKLTEFPWKTEETLFESLTCEITQKKIRHVFTHFDLTLTIVEAKANKIPEIEDGFFVKIEAFKNYPFSTLMKKVMRRQGYHKKAYKE